MDGQIGAIRYSSLGLWSIMSTVLLNWLIGWLIDWPSCTNESDSCILDNLENDLGANTIRTRKHFRDTFQWYEFSTVLVDTRG